MAFKYFERVRFLTSTTGTGTLTTGSATSAQFNDPESAGAADGDSSVFILEEGNDYEIFVGTLNITAGTLTRDTVLESRISGTLGTSKMDLLGNGVVRCGPTGHKQFIGPASNTDNKPPVFDGTDGRRFKQQDSLLSFDYPVQASPYALTTATGWDGSHYQSLTVTVNGADFTIANPSSVPTAGVYVSVYISWTTTHNIAWGNLFKGITSIAWSNTSSKKDHAVFRSNGTQLELVGVNQDISA